MTTGTGVLEVSRTADNAATAARPVIPRFSFFQIAGWLAYAVVMTLSRLAIFPLRYMVVSKGVLAITGFLCSLLLWRVYRWILRRNPSIGQIVVASVVCSYVAAALWTAADNLLDIPISAWILERDHTINGVFGLFVGSVYNAFTLLAWSLLYFGVKYYDALQTERERSLRAEAMAQKAQLEALRYQLQPHFLFNTLNAVSTLIVEHKNDEASRMIARLSDFLRLTLVAPVADDAPLSDELEFVRRYLEIEQVRFGDRLTAHFEVEQDVWAARVPHLILQPIIENAIRHGIALREEGGSLTIAARRVGSRLRIEVVNDGCSASPEAPAERERIGLANTRQRLRYSYGDDQRLDVETVGGTVRVVIELPFANRAGERVSIRVVIIDDEPLARRGIRARLRRAGDVEVLRECATGREGVVAIRELAPDLVFLDVQMPGLDGFGVVKEVGVENMPPIVFVTAFDSHALRAFEAHALDYLLKPIDDDRFVHALARARSRIAEQRGSAVAQRLAALLGEHDVSRDIFSTSAPVAPPDDGGREAGREERLLVRDEGRVLLIDVGEIDWIEAEGDYVRLHVAGRSHRLRETMSTVERTLDPVRFVRIHRSTIVNIGRVLELRPSSSREYVVLLADGTRLKLSRRFRDRLGGKFGGL